MLNSVFLFSLPGGGEWIIILLIIVSLIVSPILAIVYYSQAKRLRIENKELLERLLDKR